jgi:hypothetical protein
VRTVNHFLQVDCVSTMGTKPGDRMILLLTVKDLILFIITDKVRDKGGWDRWMTGGLCRHNHLLLVLVGLLGSDESRDI